MNVGANHKKVGPLVLLFEEVAEPQVSVGVSNRAVADIERNHDIGRVPDVALATALTGNGAYFQSTRIMIAVG